MVFVRRILKLSDYFSDGQGISNSDKCVVDGLHVCRPILLPVVICRHSVPMY